MPLSGADVVKKQLVIVNKTGAANDPASAVVVAKTLAGPVSLLDKIKGYYHTLITVLGAVLVLLNEAVGAVGWIPGYGSQIAGWVSAGIVFLTALVNFLKSNETYVDSL
jgi:hypothetical protein